MRRKTFDEWKHLVEKQITSGLSVPKFCHLNGLNPKYFYSRKAMIAKASDNAGFIHAHIVPKQTALLATQAAQDITLITSVGKLSLPGDTSPQFIAELLNGLVS